jgi:hypothetical protein
MDQGHQAKRHKVLISDIQQESLKETPSNLVHGKSTKKAPKTTKKEKREEHKQALKNHVESSIHTKKGSYNV